MDAKALANQLLMRLLHLLTGPSREQLLIEQLQQRTAALKADLDRQEAATTAMLNHPSLDLALRGGQRARPIGNLANAPRGARRNDAPSTT